MEKVKLNNQIVSMRKYVKQAKVHVINKLVKQIKLLQNRKGNEIQIQKAKRKAERFLEAVTLIKKIKPDDVSKLALSKVKDWKTVLSEKNSSVHDRCIAMLANYGAVQKEVESFYCANKELILKISDYIAQWEEKSKLPKDSPKTNSKSFIKKASENLSLEKSKKQELAGIKKSKLKTIVETESKPNKNNVVSELSNNAENINLSTEKLNISTDDMHEVLTVENSNNNRKPIRIKERKESRENDSMSDEETNSNEDSPFNGNDSDKEIKNNVLNNSNEEDENSSDEESNADETYKSVSNSPIKIDKSKNKLKAIALLNLNELEGLDEIPVSNSFKNDESDEHASSEDGMSDTSQDKNIDPFFLGHNKNDFNSNIQDDSSKDSDTDMRAKGSSNNFKSEIQGVKKPFFHQKNDQFSHKKSFQRSLCNQKYDSKPFKRNIENSFNRNHKTEKQNSFVRRDYNKTFERGNFNKNRKDFKLKDKPFPSHDSFHKKPFKNISKSYGSKEDSSFKQKKSFKKGNTSESLHPSWEAKRKQKELLSTSFQGKRIVFDD